MGYEWTMENTPAARPGQPVRATTVPEALAASQQLGTAFNAIVETLPVDPEAAGMPIAVKDVIDIAGSLTTMGSHVRPAEPATASAAVIELCAQLGLVPVAKTTCQEHSYGIMGEESVHGRGINPIWPGFTTGGSSYGSAIAVATGVVPAAIGTDTAGSVRVPAACAAVTGFKPTLGRIPTAGVAPLSDSFDTVGFFTRTLAEMAPLWQRFAQACPGPVPGQATVPAIPQARTLPARGAAAGAAAAAHPAAGAEAAAQPEAGGDAAAEGDRCVRIGVFAVDELTGHGGGTGGRACDRGWFAQRVQPWLDARIAAAERAGWQVELVDLADAFDLSEIAAVYSTVRARESWLIHRPAWEAGHRDFQPQVRANLEHDQSVTEEAYRQALAECARIRETAAEVFARVDVILTPTMGCEPVRWKDTDQNVRWAFRAYTQLFNILGWPAISVPVDALPRLLTGPDGRQRAEFPASVQLAAAPWQDTELVDFAAWFAGEAMPEADPADEDPAVEQVVLLSDDGQAIGVADKAEVHTAATPLHQAFSCFISDADGRVLLTRRALGKKTWPGVWTNALCGHPAPGEPIAAAVHRRAAEELGCRLEDLDTVLPAFRYQATDASGVVENEICPVFTARLAGDLAPLPEEVAEHAWVEPTALDAAVVAVPFMFSPWMREEWQLLRAAQQG